MKTLKIDEKLEKLLRELEFKDAKELMKDSLITEILYRISVFSEEISRYMMILWHGNSQNRGRTTWIKNLKS